MGLSLGVGLGLQHIRSGSAGTPAWYAGHASAAGVTFFTGSQVAIERGVTSQNQVIYMQLARAKWARLRLDFGSVSGGRMSWRVTQINQTHAVYTPGDFTYSGTWTQNSSATTTYTAANCGGRSVSNGTTNNYVEVTHNDSTAYDVYIVYTGRTDGGYARVDIDGAQTLVNEISDPASLGYKAFSTYFATTNTRKRWIKVASGLTGSRTIRVTTAGAKEASSTSNLIYIEAIACTAELTHAKALPPPHPGAGVVVASGHEIRNAGYYYRANPGGTTGATAPTHTTGDASDGGVTWRYHFDTSYNFISSDVDFASEREYAAVNVTVGGLSEDIGGQTHGGETSTSRVIKVDGATWNESGAFATLTSGSTITIEESTRWDHTNQASLATATNVTTITPGKYALSSTISFAATCTIANAYPAMLPGVRYDGTYQENIWDTVRWEDGTTVTLQDYVSNNVTLSAGAQYSVALIGGFEACTNACMAINASAASVNSYANTSAAAVVDVNRNTAAGTGSTDWQMKAYLTLAGGTAVTYNNGDSWVITAEHLIGSTATTPASI